MNTFLFFRYGNRTLIFFYYYLVKEYKYWKQSTSFKFPSFYMSLCEASTIFIIKKLYWKKKKDFTFVKVQKAEKTQVPDKLWSKFLKNFHVFAVSRSQKTEARTPFHN